MGSPSNATRAAPIVDGSDRKFYIKAAERSPEGKEALERFDAALKAQRSSTPASTGSSRPPENDQPTASPATRGEELARQYAPVLVLPDGKYDLPASPQDFIDNARYREDRSFWRDREHGNNINADGTDNFTAADVGQSEGGGEFLDLADNRWQLGREDAPFFYQVDDPDQPSRITYWFFYSYNDGPGPQNHEGDFERITLEIDPETGRPTDAIYSAHSNKHTEPVRFEDLQFYTDPTTGEVTEKPLVYVASGSHASYPTPGSHRSDAPDARWLGVPFGPGGLVAGDQLNGALNDQTVRSFEDAAYVIDTGGNLADVQQQAWYPENGEGIQWGEPGNADDLPGFVGGGSTSGPRGPSDEKDHVELD